MNQIFLVVEARFQCLEQDKTTYIRRPCACTKNRTRSITSMMRKPVQWIGSKTEEGGLKEKEGRQVVMLLCRAEGSYARMLVCCRQRLPAPFEWSRETRYKMMVCSTSMEPSA